MYLLIHVPTYLTLYGIWHMAIWLHISINPPSLLGVGVGGGRSGQVLDI